MGLFDKMKKKESEEVQTPQVDTVQNIGQVVSETVQPVEGNQSFVTEVSVDNNPFVEEVTPVEEAQVTSSESAAPSFDNIFNATPGDLVMPSQPAVVESQGNEVQVGNIEDSNIVSPVVNQVSMEEPAANIVEQSFPVEENQADEITQLVSEAVAATENTETVPGPTFEQNIVEEVIEAPVEAQPVAIPTEVPAESQQVEVQPLEASAEIQPTETSDVTIDYNQNLEQTIEPDLNIINESLADLAPVELISESQIVEPALEPQHQVEVAEQVASNEENVVPLEQVQVESVPEQTEIQDVEIMQGSVPDTDNQALESEIILVDEPIENLEELEPVEMSEQSLPEEQVVNQVVEVQPEENNVETTPTEPVVELVATNEDINPEVQLEPTENVTVIEEINNSSVPEEVSIEQEQNLDEVNIEPSIEYSESQEVAEEIQDINGQEVFIPEEIAASQNDIIELTSEPSVEESNDDLIMLTDEPVGEITTEPDLTQLIPEESEDAEISQTVTEETEIAPIIEEEPTDIINNEIVIPEIEESSKEETSTEEESVTESSYYSDINISEDINEEQENSEISPIAPVIENEEPVIELNITEEAVETEESTEEQSEEPEVEQVEEKPTPVITEEEPFLNLGEESVAAENNIVETEEQPITPIIEEETNDITFVNENDENNVESNAETSDEAEESVIVLSNNNIEEEEISPFESAFEIPQISEENNEEVVAENEEVTEETSVDSEEVNEAVEDISVPEFDFQSFMMTNDNDNGIDFETPAVVESQNETATYISDPTPTKFCSNCGVMLTDESSICPSCGEPID